MEIFWWKAMLYFSAILYPLAQTVSRQEMSAYVIVDIDVKDQTAYKEYIALAPATVEAYGGRYLARAGRTEKLEGDWVPKRLVILQFEGLERAWAWLESPGYKPIERLRHQAAVSNMLAIERVWAAIRRPYTACSK